MEEYIRLPSNQQLVQGIPVGKLNNLDQRVKYLETHSSGGGSSPVGGPNAIQVYGSSTTLNGSSKAVLDPTTAYADFNIAGTRSHGIHFGLDASDRATVYADHFFATGASTFADFETPNTHHNDLGFVVHGQYAGMYNALMGSKSHPPGTWDFGMNTDDATFESLNGAVVIGNHTGTEAWIDGNGIGSFLQGAIVLGDTTGTATSIDASGNITANSFIKTGGASSQFLKADGSVDSTVYASQSDSFINAIIFG